jgi:hypothetical protein
VISLNFFSMIFKKFSTLFHRFMHIAFPSRIINAIKFYDIKMNYFLCCSRKKKELISSSLCQFKDHEWSKISHKLTLPTSRTRVEFEAEFNDFAALKSTRGEISFVVKRKSENYFIFKKSHPETCDV